MKKQIINLGMCVVLALVTLNCAKKTVSQSSTSTQTESSATSNTTTSAAADAVDYNVYSGKYKMQSDQIGLITITVENNRIYGEAEGQPKTEIKPEGKDSFNVPDFNAKVIFNRDSNQKVSGLTLFINGEEVSGNKIE